MIMAGAVKIQSQAERPPGPGGLLTEEGHTWLDLTALSFHFATQCIPTPLAWYASQLPDSALQMGVLICFVVEVPATI